MYEFLKSVLGFVAANRFFANLAFALAFSLLVTLAAGHFLHYLVVVTSPSVGVTMGPEHGREVAGFFLGLLTLTTIGGLMSTRRAKDDVLTPIRRKLQGQWLANIDTYRLDDPKGGEARDVIFGNFSNTCEFTIDPVTAKLVLTIHVQNTDLFQHTKVSTTNIHIEGKGKCSRLIFYETFEFSVNEAHAHEFADRTVVMPMICVLDFDADQPAISSLNGYWYDIENTVFNTLSQVAGPPQLAKMKADLDDGRRTMKGNAEFLRTAVATVDRSGPTAPAPTADG